MTTVLVGIGRRTWLPVTIIVTWWLTTAGSDSFYFPSLQHILETFARDWFSDRVVTDLLPSLRNLTLGFAIASIAGIGAGLLIGSIPRVAATLIPLIHFVRSMPPPVLLPVALLVLGAGTSMKITIIAFGAMWPTLLNTIDGVRGVAPELRLVSKAYHFTRWERIRYVILPAAGPQIAAGLRTTLQISIILIVVSEMVASTGGIGYYVLLSQQTFAVPETWAGTILLGLVGFVCNALFAVAERRVLHWKYAPDA